MKVREDLPLPAELLREMSETQQNPRYHAEGSVLAHTELVLEKYRSLSSEFELSPADHEVLYWAAILHDTGKTKTTRLENGRWRSPEHERAGVPIAQDILLQHPEITGPQRRRILDLVRWHGFPLQFGRTQQPIDNLKLLGTRTDLRLLAIFSYFDFHGRICEDREWVMQVIERFMQHDVPKVEYELGRYEALQARFEGMNLRHKNALWTAFSTQQAPFVEKLIEAAAPKDIETFDKKVIVTIGAPLSGKTHWLAENMPNTFRVSMAEHGMSEEDLGDKYYKDRKLVEFKHFLTVYTNRHRQVVLDGRNLDVPFRHRLNEMIRGLDVELEYLVFEESLSKILARNAASAEPLEPARLAELYAAQELVHPWEAHRVRYMGRGD